MLVRVVEFRYVGRGVSGENVECGYRSLGGRKIKFSRQFFMISVVFVMFDIELMAMLPLPVIVCREVISLGVVFMLVLLILRLMIEWVGGVLEWLVK